MEKKKAGALWRVTENFQKAIMAIASIFIVFSICATVLMRYIFQTDLYGIEEIIMMVSFWLYFLGSSLGSCERSQISADVITAYLKKDSHKRIMNIITSIVTTAVCILVTKWAWDFIAWNMQMNPKTPVFRLPVLIPQFAILIGFVMMSFYNVYYLITDTLLHLKLSKAGK